MPTWILFALLSAVSAAFVAIFGKIGLGQVDSTLATAVRSVVMAAFLVLTATMLGKHSLLSTINGRALTFIVLSGVAALDRLSVVFVLILSIPMLGQRLNWQAGVGALFITLGAILMTRA